MSQKPISDEEISHLRKLTERATPGPWEVGGHPSKVISPCPCCGPIATCAQFGAGEDSPECYNSEYIAGANPAVILALLDRFDEILKELRGR